jgi:hypothetical protein
MSPTIFGYLKKGIDKFEPWRHARFISTRKLAHFSRKFQKHTVSFQRNMSMPKNGHMPPVMPL